MNPTPEPTIYDIVIPKFVVFPNITNIALSLLACAVAVYLLGLLVRYYSKPKLREELLRELKTVDTSSHEIICQLATRAAFLVCGENLATFTPRELAKFAERFPKLQQTAAFLAERFSPTSQTAPDAVVKELIGALVSKDKP